MDFNEGESNMTALAIHQPQHPEKAMVAMGSSGAIVRSFDDLARLSTMIFKSGLAPREMNTPEKIGVAIMWGMEVGLPPMQAIQSITVINNRPCLWGDALPAMVLSSAVCESVHEEFRGEGDNLTAVCTTKRKGFPEHVTKTFGVVDAKKANLWDKAGPWQNYPKRMLQIRARAWNFRDNFADVLRGMQVREEVEDIAVSAQVVETHPESIPAEPVTAPKSELDDFAETPETISPSPEPAPVSSTAPVSPDIEAEAAQALGQREESNAEKVLNDPLVIKKEAKAFVKSQSEAQLRDYVNSFAADTLAAAMASVNVRGVTAAHPLRDIQNVAFALKTFELTPKQESA
jgi:hypothetical protein